MARGTWRARSKGRGGRIHRGDRGTRPEPKGLDGMMQVVIARHVRLRSGAAKDALRPLAKGDGSLCRVSASDSVSAYGSPMRPAARQVDRHSLRPCGAEPLATLSCRLFVDTANNSHGTVDSRAHQLGDVLASQDVAVSAAAGGIDSLCPPPRETTGKAAMRRRDCTGTGSPTNTRCSSPPDSCAATAFICVPAAFGRPNTGRPGPTRQPYGRHVGVGGALDRPDGPEVTLDRVRVSPPTGIAVTGRYGRSIRAWPRRFGSVRTKHRRRM